MQRWFISKENGLDRHRSIFMSAEFLSDRRAVIATIIFLAPPTRADISIRKFDTDDYDAFLAPHWWWPFFASLRHLHHTSSSDALLTQTCGFSQNKNWNETCKCKQLKVRTHYKLWLFVSFFKSVYWKEIVFNFELHHWKKKVNIWCFL